MHVLWSQSAAVSAYPSLEVSYGNVINCKKILLPPNIYILTCTSVMCDLQGLCDSYNVFMTLCNIRHTKSVCGPHAARDSSVWTTLFYMNKIVRLRMHTVT